MNIVYIGNELSYEQYPGAHMLFVEGLRMQPEERAAVKELGYFVYSFRKEEASKSLIGGYIEEGPVASGYGGFFIVDRKLDMPRGWSPFHKSAGYDFKVGTPMTFAEWSDKYPAK